MLKTLDDEAGFTDILSLTARKLAEFFQVRYGKGTHHADALYRQVFRAGIFAPQTLPEYRRSAAFVDTLHRQAGIRPPRIVQEQTDDGVVKLVGELADGHRIESVVIPMARAKTLCVSSQVGCRMGCAFCQTGRMGLVRNLSVPEIVGQVLTARRRYGPCIRNVVFMGMGEPLDNLENVMQSVAVLADPLGLAIPHRRMTLSTSGMGEGIEKLAALPFPKPYLAVSLNAANDELRTRLMPVNSATPIGRLREILGRYPLGKKERILIGYVLFRGMNDSREHASDLAAYVRPLNPRVNVIAYNPTAGAPFEAPTPEEVDRFTGYLASEGIFVRRRTPKGRNLMAACGQLGKVENQ